MISIEPLHNKVHCTFYVTNSMYYVLKLLDLGDNVVTVVF